MICIFVLAGWASSAPADDPPRELARWLAPQRWERDTPGPIVSLGANGAFDDMHIFAPTVALEQGKFSLWYCGSRGTPGSRSDRVFRLGFATSADGKKFERHSDKPVLQFADQEHSIVTPALLRQGDGAVLREDGKLRMWYSSVAFAKSGLHTLHESTSADGIHWSEPSTALMKNVYSPTILKSPQGYTMWYSDVSKRPWVIRHAQSLDGKFWTATDRPALELDQSWEDASLFYPTVLHVDGVYLMWYGSYNTSARKQTTAIGFAASLDGKTWFKHSQNPVFKSDPQRPWESHYVGSGCVMRLSDGSFRYWYASRKAPPHDNTYFALNTARWSGLNK